MSEDSSTPTLQDLTVPHQYERWARVYDLLWRRYMNQTLPVLQRTANLTPGERILDLGSGTGELARRICASTPGLDIVGVDLAPAMVEQAQQKLENVEAASFVHADAHELPFEDASFDVVVSASTFHYLTFPHRVLQEVGRVLRPEGRLVVLDWCRDFWTCRVMDVVLTMIDPAHRRCYTLDEVVSLFGASPLTFRSGFRYRFDVVWGMMVVEARA